MRLIDADATLKRLKAIEDAHRQIKELGACHGLLMAQEVVMESETIEPKRGRWIPCSERLPEDDALMLVNYIDNRPDAVDIWIGWHEMENVWYIDGEEHSKERGNEVIAWMPLPEPWRGNNG